jgi:hypothetical protein
MTTSALSSGLKTGAGVISPIKARVNGIVLIGDGTNPYTVTLYDNATAATGRILAIAAANTGQVQHTMLFVSPLLVENGIYASTSGTGGSFIVYYGA